MGMPFSTTIALSIPDVDTESNGARGLSKNPCRREEPPAPPQAGWSAAQSACLRFARSRKGEEGEKCRQFGQSLSFLALPPFPTV